MSWLALAGLTLLPQPNPASSTAVQITLANDAKALGADALRAVRTRVTHGTFDNGRTRVPFTTYEKTPNMRLTIIGTGLRDVTGRELLEVAREADLQSPTRPDAACVKTATLAPPAADGSAVLHCELGDSRTATMSFSPGTRLLSRRDIEEGGRSTFFEVYRLVDGVRVTFVTRYVAGSVTVSYMATSVEHNVPVDDARFMRPES